MICKIKNLLGEVSIVIANKNSCEKLEVVKKIKWESSLGDITFNSGNTITIESRFYKMLFDIDNQSIIMVEEREQDNAKSSLPEDDNIEITHLFF